MQVSPDHAWQVYREADCIHDREAVETALDRLSVRVSADLRERNPVVLGAMVGGVVVLGKLLGRLAFPLQVDYVHLGRYGNALRGGDIEWFAKPRISLRDRSVLIVDDVLDEGYTLLALQEYCAAQGAISVDALVLVEKQRQRRISVTARYVGLYAPDRYLFGCGMDYQGFLRNLPGIYALAEPDDGSTQPEGEQGRW